MADRCNFPNRGPGGPQPGVRVDNRGKIDIFGRPVSAGEMDDQLARVGGSHGPFGLTYPPERVGVDILDFKAEVTAAGVITQPQTGQLPGGNMFAILREIRGYQENPDTEPELTTRMKFNILDNNRSGRPLFSSKVRMAALAGYDGQSGMPIRFDEGRGYRFDPQSRIDVEFTADSDYATNADNATEFGVVLVFDMYRAAPREG